MKKTRLVLTALMIVTMTVTGASFAEAGLKVDDVKIVVEAKDHHRPPAPERRDAPEQPEAHRPDGHGGPKDDYVRPNPKPTDERKPDFGPHHEAPHGPGHHKPGHNAPPKHHKPHHGGRR